jgi:membrane protein insertase Oxa1/YidC/SpoIIIJ
MKNYNPLLGLVSLLLFIPIPTLIFNVFKTLSENGVINLLAMHLSGAQAQMLLFTLLLAGIALMSLSLRELGGVLNSQL